MNPKDDMQNNFVNGKSLNGGVFYCCICKKNHFEENLGATFMDKTSVCEDCMEDGK